MTDLVAELGWRGVSDVSDPAQDRTLYSADASLYRVAPRHVDELIDAARPLGVPLTMRRGRSGCR